VKVVMGIDDIKGDWQYEDMTLKCKGVLVVKVGYIINDDNGEVKL